MRLGGAAVKSFSLQSVYITVNTAVTFRLGLFVTELLTLNLAINPIPATVALTLLTEARLSGHPPLWPILIDVSSSQIADYGTRCIPNAWLFFCETCGGWSYTKL
jgi:hypothetical protein